MGSLMSGWHSPVQDPKLAKLERNRSLTKEEIEAFWKSKKKIEEEHLKEISGFPQGNLQECMDKGAGAGAVLQKSISFPLTGISTPSLQLNDAITDYATITKAKDWWTRSNWAFLNEPPVIAPEESSRKYASQYHVTNLCKYKQENRAGIST